MIPKLVFYSVLLIALLGYQPLSSQDKNSALYGTGGLAVTILDSGIGGSLGLTGLKKINKYIGLEAQVNYIGARINGSFISGRKGSINALNGLAGLRLYFNPKDEYRFYVNGLIGGSFVNEKLEGLDLEPEFTGGASIGAFFDFNDKYIAGVCFESPSFIVLRFGYKLL